MLNRIIYKSWRISDKISLVCGCSSYNFIVFNDQFDPEVFCKIWNVKLFPDIGERTLINKNDLSTLFEKIQMDPDLPDHITIFCPVLTNVSQFQKGFQPYESELITHDFLKEAIERISDTQKKTQLLLDVCDRVSDNILDQQVLTRLFNLLLKAQGRKTHLIEYFTADLLWYKEIQDLIFALDLELDICLAFDVEDKLKQFIQRYNECYSNTSNKNIVYSMIERELKKNIKNSNILVVMKSRNCFENEPFHLRINGVPVLFRRYSATSILKPYFGESEKFLRELFICDLGCQKHVLWIDNLEIFAKKNMTTQSNLSRNILTTLLLELDGVCTRNPNLLVVGTCNCDPEELEPALVRPGRLAKWIEY